jgi:hypothetical protein
VLAFCHQCGSQVDGRFCASCGTESIASGAAAAPPLQNAVDAAGDGSPFMKAAGVVGSLIGLAIALVYYWPSLSPVISGLFHLQTTVAQLNAVDLKTTIGTAAEGPFKITKCTARAYETTDSAGSTVHHLSIFMSVQSAIDQNIIAIGTVVTGSDDFGKVIGDGYLDAGALEAHSSSEGIEWQIDRTLPTVSAIECAPREAHIASGDWKATLNNADVPSIKTGS